MINNWRVARKLMAAYLCNCDRFIITAHLDDNTWIKFSNFDCVFAVHPKIASLLNGAGAVYADVEFQDIESPEVLNARCTETGVSSWRIDAVTRGSLPVADIPQVVDAWVPSSGRGDQFNSNNVFPAQIFRIIANTWNEACRYLGVNQQTYVPPRYVLPGTQEYVAPPSGRPCEFVNHSIRNGMPRGIIDEHSYDLITPNSRKEFPADPVWMARVIFELLPVPMYHRIVYGEHKLVNLNVGDYYEGTVIGVYDGDIQKAYNIMDYCIKYIKTGVRLSKGCGLAYAPAVDNASLRTNREQWKSPQALQIPEKSDGMCSMGVPLLDICDRSAIVCYSDQLDSLRLDYTKSDIYRKLAAQHDNDALAPVIGDAWEE